MVGLGVLVVAGGDAAPLLQAVDAAFKEQAAVLTFALAGTVRLLRDRRSGTGEGVGRGGRRRRGCAPQSKPAIAGAPSWESFPEVNRVVVQRLLGLLVERMAAATPPRSRDGGAGDDDGQAAVGAAGGQGPAVAS